MLSFTFGGVKVCIHFLFFACITLCLLLDHTGIAALGLLAGLMHESGHLAAMLLLRRPPDCISLEINGIRLSEDLSCVPFREELFLLISGSSVNFLCFFLFRTGGMPTLFGWIHLFLGVLNLIPLNSLDGGKLLLLFLEQIFSVRTAHLVLFWVQVFFLGALSFVCFSMFFQKNGNFTFFVLCGYTFSSFCMEFIEDKSA